MAIGDIFEMRLRGNYLGQNTLNVYHYRQTAVGSGGNAGNLIGAFNTIIMPLLADALNEDAHWTDYVAFNIQVPTDYFEFPATITAGDREVADDAAPSWVVATVQYNRFGAGSRYSYKRHSGLLLGDVDGNSLTSSFVSLLTPYAAASDGPISNAGHTFEPVQVKSGYTLGEAPVVNGTIVNYVGIKLGSQDTRKGS